MKMDNIIAHRMSGMCASEIRELLKILNQPDVVNFAGGIPDPALFPAAAFQEASQRALAPAVAGDALQYSVSEGYMPLRQWIAERMAGLGITCTAEQVFITSGSQQALDYLGKLFLSPGDTALVQWPTYLGALGAFNAYEPRYEALYPFDNRSPKDLVKTAAAAESRIKFAYLSPDFANPTGQTLTQDERLDILDRAEQLDCALLEDAAYQSLRYDGAAIPPILALEQARNGGDINACRTIYCGTFSKTLSPGLRVGWVVAAQPVIDRLVLLKQAGDLHSATLNQMLVADVVQTGFDAHVEGLRSAYRARRDAMLAALAAEMPTGVAWTRPEGGMFVWLTLPEGMDAAVLLQRSLATEKVAFVPGQAFYADGGGKNTLRLSFANADMARIKEGIARLGRVLSNEMRRE